MSARQRLIENMQLLNIEPKKSLGQNFLISDHAISKIIESVKLKQPRFLIEIGPGLGALTFFLKDLECRKVLVEMDTVFAQFWQKAGMEVVEADALRIDWQQFDSQPGPRVLVSNLPYQISSTLVIDRSLDEKPLDRMTLMFQKEVAQRIRARQQDELYGMLSVVSQSFWKIETLLEASSQDFFPPPKVASRVLTFDSIASPVGNKRKYFQFIKACFIHPRKFMVSNLEEAGGVSKLQASHALNSLGFSEKVRAGELKVNDFLRLYQELGLEESNGK